MASSQSVVHEGWVLHHQSSRSSSSNPAVKKWTRFWMTLRENTLSFHSSSSRMPDTMVGSLTISSHAEFSEIPAEMNPSGFGFQLQTVTKNVEVKNNMLLFDNKNDCDLWKAFISAVSRGVIPVDVQLKPDQFIRVTDVIKHHPAAASHANVRQAAVNTWHPVDRHGQTRHGDVIERYNQQPDDVNRRRSLTSQSSVQTPSTHKFYNDAHLNSSTPIWFVECNREKAESILSMSRLYGNVLLRPCSSEPNTKYALSYRIDASSGCRVNHYAVVGDKTGFKIDVIDQHHIMQSLSDVMHYFIHEVGPSVRPLSKLSLSNFPISSAAAVGVSRQQEAHQENEYGSALDPSRTKEADSNSQLYTTYSGTKAAAVIGRQSASGPLYSHFPVSGSTSPQTQQDHRSSLYSDSLSASRDIPSSQHVPQTPPDCSPQSPAPPPPPPPPPPPQSPPILPLTPSKTQGSSNKGQEPKSSKEKASANGNSLQQDLHKELQSKLSKYKKDTYSSPKSPIKLSDDAVADAATAAVGKVIP